MSLIGIVWLLLLVLVLVFNHGAHRD